MEVHSKHVAQPCLLPHVFVFKRSRLKVERHLKSSCRELSTAEECFFRFECLKLHLQARS